MFSSGKLTIGLNYWASGNATRMWKDWNRDIVEKDLALFEQYGITLLRVFPLWSDFQPIRLLQYGSSTRGTIDREVCLGDDERPLPDTLAGRSGMDETMLDHFRELCDIAVSHNIKLIPAIMTAHMTGRHFVPPAIENKDMMTDPFALKWGMKFYDCFVRTFKDHPAIAAWETGNEMNYTAPVKSADHAWVWTRMMHDIIRLADPEHPIVGVMAEGLDPANANWLIADQGELADFGSVHRYDIQNPAAADGWMHLRNLYRNAAECRLITDIGGKPCFTEETGNWRNLALSLDGVGNAVNALLWNAWREDNRAFLWWCAFDQTEMNFAPYHWGDWPGLEHGVFSAEHQAHPAAEKMYRFRQMLDDLPFGELPAVKPDALCLADDLNVGLTTYTLARQAGINLQFQAARAPLQDADVYILPSVACRGGIASEDWQKLCAKVQAGAICFITADDCNLPHLREFCGMQIVRRRQAVEPMRCVIDGEELVIKCQLEKLIQPENADVLLKDQNGNAVLLHNKFGQGHVYTLTFALEKTIFNTPRALDANWWKLYRYAVPKDLLLESCDSSVILTEHYFSNTSAAVIAVNCAEEAAFTQLVPAADWQITAVYGDGSLSDDMLQLPTGGGAVLMLKKL